MTDPRQDPPGPLTVGQLIAQVERADAEHQAAQQELLERLRPLIASGPPG